MMIATSGREFRYVYSANDERVALIEKLPSTPKTTWTIRNDGGNLLRSFVLDGTTCATTTLLPLPIDSQTNHSGSLTYDAAGNVLTDGSRTFAYDAASMMTATSTSGREFRHVYNANDERVALIECMNG